MNDAQHNAIVENAYLPVSLADLQDLLRDYESVACCQPCCANERVDAWDRIRALVDEKSQQYNNEETS